MAQIWEELVDYRRRADGVAIITMGAAANDLYQLRAAFEDLRVNPKALVGVITGAGELAQAGADWDPLREVWKPVIAAIEGRWSGLRASLVLAADIRIASNDAALGPFEATGSWLAGGGALARLPRQIAHCHAMEVLLTGRAVTAQEMLRFGLVNEVVPPPQLMPRALEIAEMLVTKCDRDALLVTKQCVVRGFDGGMGQALVEEALYTEMLDKRRGNRDTLRERAERLRRG